MPLNRKAFATSYERYMNIKKQLDRINSEHILLQANVEAGRARTKEIQENVNKLLNEQEKSFNQIVSRLEVAAARAID